MPWQKVLVKKIINRLRFDTLVTNIRNRVSKKLYVLERVSQFMSIH